MTISTKRLPWIALGLLVFLVLSTQIRATGDVVEQAKQYFTPEEIEAGQTRAAQSLWIWWAGLLAHFAVLVYLAFSPIGKRIYLKTGELVHGHWFTHLILLSAIVITASALVRLPFQFARYQLNLSWELDNRTMFGWLQEVLIADLVGGIGEMIAVLGLYAIIRYSNRAWWLFAGAASVLFAYFVAFIKPDVVDPLFNNFTKLSQTEWKLYEVPISFMCGPAEFSPSDILVVDASRQSNHGNAYFTGFGPTQRIILYDTLLKNHSREEVFTIVAHELGHYWEKHILKGILLGGLFATVGLYLLSGYLNALVEAGTLRKPSDPAGVFRVFLFANLALAVSMPIQNYVSRRFEREADMSGLFLSKNAMPDRSPASAADAFIKAEIRLAKQNKANVAPSRWNVILFSSHPTVVERIQMAKDWAAANKK